MWDLSRCCIRGIFDCRATFEVGLVAEVGTRKSGTEVVDVSQVSSCRGEFESGSGSS